MPNFLKPQKSVNRVKLFGTKSFKGLKMSEIRVKTFNYLSLEDIKMEIFRNDRIQEVEVKWDGNDWFN